MFLFLFFNVIITLLSPFLAPAMFCLVLYDPLPLPHCYWIFQSLLLIIDERLIVVLVMKILKRVGWKIK